MYNENNLNEWKKQYENIIIPEKLSERVEQSCQNAIKDRTKNNIVRMFNRIGLGIAAAVMLLFVTVNIGVTTSYALYKIPVIGSIAQFLTINTYQDDQYGIVAKIDIPEISGLSNSNAQDELNEAVNEYVDMLVEWHNESVALAKEAYENSPEIMENSHTAKQTLETTCKIITDNEKVFSMKLDTILVMAGATNLKKHFTIDKQTGQLLKLSDLFKEDSNYVDKICNSIKYQMNENTKNDKTKSYFSECVKTAIKEEEDFYITKDGELVLSFDKYSVAAGYMGALEFKIPTSEISDILIKDYIK